MFLKSTTGLSPCPWREPNISLGRFLCWDILRNLPYPLKNVNEISMAAATKVLRFPGKSLDCDSAHALDELDGPQMVQIDAFMKSCMTRAGHQTLSGFEAQCKVLFECSLAHNCLGALSPINPGGGTSTPHGWDAPAFCENLLQAVESLPLTSIDKGHSKKSLQALCFEVIPERLPMGETSQQTCYDVPRL